MELNYTFWQEKDGWFLGFLDEYPEYWTQGQSIKELEEMLLDIYKNEQEEAPQEIPKRQTGKIVLSVA
ncbi:type II toxin-antitoxin system HicB family antitoxin [Treponema sp. R80B11-R83G3]